MIFKSSLSLGDSNLKKTCFETCNFFSDAIKGYYVVISHETGFKTCFGIIQRQLDEEKKVYKLEVISTFIIRLTCENVSQWGSLAAVCSL